MKCKFPRIKASCTFFWSILWYYIYGYSPRFYLSSKCFQLKSQHPGTWFYFRLQVVGQNTTFLDPLFELLSASQTRQYLQLKSSALKVDSHLPVAYQWRVSSVSVPSVRCPLQNIVTCILVGPFSHTQRTERTALIRNWHVTDTPLVSVNQPECCVRLNHLAVVLLFCFKYASVFAVCEDFL
jgi:hypothetical protein